MRRPVAGSIVLTLLLVLVVWTVPSPAGASPTPWTWVSAQAVGYSDAGGSYITATCPAGYQAVSGGVDQGGSTIQGVVINGRQYSVLVYEQGGKTVTVSAWCALASQVAVSVFDRTLITDRPFGSGSAGQGLGDFACDGDMTPVGAGMAWTSGEFDEIDQSGPETIGGTNEWFITARSNITTASLSIQLYCVANADLPGAHWVTQSQTAGASQVQESVTAVCPNQERFVTGGEHIDSIAGYVKRSLPEGAQAWNTVADVPAHDTLSVSVLCVPAGEPIASFTSGPPRLTSASGGIFTFTAVDPAAIDTASNWCFFNTTFLGLCTDRYTVTGLTDGVYVFSIEAITPDGRGGAPTEKDYYFTVDLTPPTLSVKALPAFTLGGSVSLKATANDLNGILHYGVVETARQASGSGASTANPVVTTQTTTTGQLTVPVRAGKSYSFAVKAFDNAGNVSSTRTVSTAVPLDNLDLTASSQWSLIQGSVYTHGLVSRTTAKGATLKKIMYGKTLGVVATTCPTCGQVGVYAGTTLLKTINLAATGTHYRQVITVPLGAHPVQTPVTIKVLSTGKLVEIDGLGALVS